MTPIDHEEQHVVKSNLDAVNVFLDPGVACAPAYRARFRVTRAGVPVYLAQLESEWEVSQPWVRHSGFHHNVVREWMAADRMAGVYASICEELQGRAGRWVLRDPRVSAS